MSDPMFVAPVGSKDAAAIHALQHRLFPPVLTESLDEITSILRNAEQHLVCNMSFGLFKGTEMVGYVFAFVEERSIYFDRDEEVLYMKEVAILPGNERFLLLLLSKLFMLRTVFAPQLPAEAHAQADALDLWRRLKMWNRRFGATFSATGEIVSEGMPPYARLRWEFDPTASPYDQARPFPKRTEGGPTVIVDPGQWLGARDGWDRLLARTSASAPSQSFRALWHWWRYFGIWDELRLVHFYDGDELSGIAPLMLSHERIAGRAWRKISLVGVLDGAVGPPLIIGSDSRRYVAPLLDWLEGTDWDVLEIARQPDGRVLDELRAGILDRRWLLDESHEYSDSVEVSELDDRRGDAVPVDARAAVGRRDDSGLTAIDSGRIGDVLDRCWELHESGRAKSTPGNLFVGKEPYYFFLSLAGAKASSVALEVRTVQTGTRSEATAFGFTDDGVHQVVAVQYSRRRSEPDPLAALFRGMATNLASMRCTRIEAPTGILDRVPGCRVRRSVVRTFRVYRSDAPAVRARRRRERMERRMDDFIQGSELLQNFRRWAKLAVRKRREP